MDQGFGFAVFGGRDGGGGFAAAVRGADGGFGAGAAFSGHSVGGAASGSGDAEVAVPVVAADSVVDGDAEAAVPVAGVFSISLVAFFVLPAAFFRPWPE